MKPKKKPKLWLADGHGRAAQPDLLVTDIMMPSLDGLGLVRRLRHSRNLASVPVVVISVLDRREPKLAQFETIPGVVIVSKPFSVRAFQEVVAGLITEPAAPEDPAA